MKRILALILTLLMVFSVVLSCESSNNNDLPNYEEESKESNENIKNEQVENIGNGDKQEEDILYVPKVESTAGLEFQLNDDKKSYTVIGIGTCTATDITIDGYKNLPVTRIGDYAFYGCTGLTSVTIGDSVTNICKRAFYECSGLMRITISNRVTSITDEAFYNCTNLTGVYINDIAKWCNINFINYFSNPLFYAKKLYLNEKLVTNLEIPNGVREIKNFAFLNCIHLTRVTIPNSVTRIGNAVFYQCTGLTNVIIPNGVTTIDQDAFYYCKKITSINIPESVTTIGDSAFKFCSGLTNVIIPNSVTSIGKDVFDNCNALETTTFDNAVYLGNIQNPYLYLWHSTNKNITTLSIHPKTKIIGGCAFIDCRSLMSVTIPDNVISIGGSAFFNTGYDNIESNWENGVLYIGEYLIYAKNNISGEYTVKSGTKYIVDAAFRYCDKLTSVTIPDSVMKIGDSAFYCCNNLTNINYRGTEEQWNDIAKGSNSNYQIPSACVITFNYTGK